ncbi:MAG: NAD-dependent epimerase/dehydratase family protein [Deltaproteobacteria bacterium]|jgi:nucleoside-diphosphate-sugar epimerase|nr:NAD-dependent epimerase/dehydratase family protein [Deltaproteobacteria bacterium]
MSVENRPILVTGAAGWLGLGLTRALVEGIPGIFDGQPFPAPSLRALLGPNDVDTDLTSIAPGVELFRGDVTNPDSLKPFFHKAEGGILFHCVGIIHPRKVKDFYAVNTQGTVNVWDEAAKAGIQRAIITSSNSPCGNNPHLDHLFDESSPYNPYMGYGRSKALMEQRIKERSQQGGPETVIIRAPWFYGPFQPPRQTEFFVMIRDGKGPILGRGLNRRSMSYIDNLAQGLILAAKEPKAAGKTYWLADRRPYSMVEIIDTVEKVLETDFGIKCRRKRLRLPSIASDVAGLVDWGLQKAGIYNQKVHVLSELNKTIACSVALAEQELGYRPLVELEEGMRRSVAWLMDRPLERAKLLK